MERLGKYEIGRQPCANFKPRRTGNEYAEWDNVHECCGPFDDSGRKCKLTVSFCENCYSDHHENGIEKCGEGERDAELERKAKEGM